MNPSEVRVVFMGSPEFAVPALRALAAAGYNLVAVYAQPDRPAGRGRKLAPPPVKLAAQELEIAVRQPESLRRPEEVHALRELAPDLIAVAAFGQILRPAVIDLPRFGCLNVHASLLPRWRGASCIAAAILAGDAETGVTIMQIDPGMDTGPILAQRRVAIADGDTTASLSERLSHAGAELLVETLPAWLAATLKPVPQDESIATLAPRLEKDAGLIDWRKPALQLWREVRAYYPWPLSSTSLRGEHLQILEALPLLHTTDLEATPGTVIALPSAEGALPPDARRRAGFAVIAGEGLLVPLVVRRAGRPAVTAAEFARGARDLLGSRLG